MLPAMTEPVRPSTVSPDAVGPGTVGPDGRAPWLLARLAQGAIPVTAVAEVFRAVTVRAHRLHPESTSAGRSAFSSMVLVYAMTAAIVLFLLWFSRSRRNARAISPEATLGSDAWAVVAWLIPLANFWFPRGLLLGTLRASGSGATQASQKGRDDLLVNAWWLAWAGHGVIALVAQSRTSLPLLVLSEALFVAAAGLAVVVIQRITALQDTALHAVRPAVEESPAV